MRGSVFISSKETETEAMKGAHTIFSISKMSPPYHVLSQHKARFLQKN